MKQVNFTPILPAWILLPLLIACNRSAPGSANRETDTMPMTGDTSVQPPYDPNMDAIHTGGTSVKKIGDTLNIKMYIATMKPGDSAVLHNHPDHTVYVLQGGKLAVYFQGVQRHEMELKTGDGFVSGPLSDAAKNIGNTTVMLLIHDVYRPRGKALQ